MYIFFVIGGFWLVDDLILLWFIIFVFVYFFLFDLMELYGWILFVCFIKVIFMVFLFGCLFYFEIVLEGVKVRGCLGMEIRFYFLGIELYVGLFFVVCLFVLFFRKDIYLWENYDFVDYVGLLKFLLGVYMVDCCVFFLDGVCFCVFYFIVLEYL